MANSKTIDAISKGPYQWGIVPDDEHQKEWLDKHFGFVVHGLWPQSEAGMGPMSCPSDPVGSDEPQLITEQKSAVETSALPPRHRRKARIVLVIVPPRKTRSYRKPAGVVTATRFRRSPRKIEVIDCPPQLLRPGESPHAQ